MQEIDIELKVSRTFIFLWLIFLSLSLLIITFSTLTLDKKILVNILSFLYGVLILIQYLKQILKIRIEASEHFWLIKKARKTHRVEILGETTITRWFIVLRYKHPSHFFNQTCLVFRDSVNSDDYRRLGVALRFWR